MSYITFTISDNAIIMQI